MWQLLCLQASMGAMPYAAHEVLPISQHATITEMTQHGSTVRPTAARPLKFVILSCLSSVPHPALLPVPYI